MARITVEDCLKEENNRFALVQLAARRTKQLLQGAKSLTPEPRGNKAVVTALREIAEGQVSFMSEDEVRRAKEEAAKAKEALLQELQERSRANEAMDPGLPGLSSGFRAPDDMERERERLFDAD